MLKRMLALAAVAAVTALAPRAEAGTTLDGVRQRNLLACGVNVGVAGFSLPDSQGVWRGLDVDFCRAIAAAVLGDADRVRYVPLSAAQRFVALQSGEVDVLIRQTTLTLARDTTLGLRAVGVNLYDGHGFLVRREANVRELRDLDGATICLLPGSTNELVTADAFRAAGIRFTPVLQERMEDNATALQAGRCDAIGSDATQLAAVRSQFPRAEDFVVLDQRFSKEPLGPMVRRDDAEWFDAVRWVINGLIEAEELGVTAANAEEMRASSTNQNVRRLLGGVPEIAQAIKLRPSWMLDAIRATGNYGEIYDRNLGPATRIALPRGLNDLWTRGGIMYAWPIR